MPNGSNSAAMRASGRTKRGQHSQSCGARKHARQPREFLFASPNTIGEAVPHAFSVSLSSLINSFDHDPFASHFSPRYHGLTKIKASLPAKALRRLIHKTPRLSDIGPLPWWDAKLADRRNELAFIWTGDLRFRMLNDDFAGRTTYETAILYYNELREGL